MHIGMDVDGVLADFIARVREIGIGLGYDIPDFNPRDWDWDDWHLTVKQRDEIWEEIRNTKNFWETLPEYARNVNTLLDFCHRYPDVKITFLTSRNQTVGDGVVTQTINWLESQCWIDISGNPDIYAVYSCSSHDKPSIAKKLGITHMLDDKGETVAGMRFLGIEAYLHRRAWNEDFGADVTESMRVDSVRQFLDIVRCAIKREEEFVLKIEASQEELENASIIVDKDGNVVKNRFSPTTRTFTTGATRDMDRGKLDYEGFLSPAVLESFGRYMNKHRLQADGTLRASDNWTKGIPRREYAKSLWRHFMDAWLIIRGMKGRARTEDLEEALCGVFFNTQGLLHEYLIGRDTGEEAE